MFSKTKKTAILIATSALLATSLGGNLVFADSTTTTGNDTSTLNVTNSSADTTATTQAAYNDIDIASVKIALLSELNNLRAQNGLPALKSVEVLSSYAQTRTDSFVNHGVDNHANWDKSQMYPYSLTAEENISQMPYYMIGSTDPATIAQKVTQEFYNEMYDSNPNYGHRKNMLNPYINYVGIGVSISSNGLVYVAQEMGNDQASYDQYDPNDVYAYYLTKYNDYANASKYTLSNTNKDDPDYTSRDGYQTADMRGGVTTKDYTTSLYDRYGNKRTDLELSPNSDWISDVVATINGKNYYHVSTNGFVSADDALPWARFLYGIHVRTTTNAVVYDNNGNITGESVPANSEWNVDRRAVNPRTNNKMYRIATNAWIEQQDLVEY